MSMSKIKNMSRGGWIVVGFVVALLVVPSVAVAATLKFTGIKGTNEATSTLNEAGVTSAGQLLTNEADPSQYVVVIGYPTCASGGFYTVPSTKGLIVTGVTLTVTAEAAGSAAQGAYFGPSASPCTDGFAASASAGTTADYQLLQPGVAVPAGDSLGAVDGNNDDGLIVYGYLVPAGAVPANAAQNVTEPNGRVGSYPLIGG
jgi:hypothetical protein